jgi:hypothetical protein
MSRRAFRGLLRIDPLLGRSNIRVPSSKTARRPPSPLDMSGPSRARLEPREWLRKKGLAAGKLAVCGSATSLDSCYRCSLLCGPLRILRGLCGKIQLNRKVREVSRKVTQRNEVSNFNLQIPASDSWFCPVTARYVWSVTGPTGTTRVAKEKRFGCGKVGGMWICN